MLYQCFAAMCVLWASLLIGCAREEPELAAEVESTVQPSTCAVKLGLWPSRGKNSAIYLGVRDGSFADAGIELDIVESYARGVSLLEGGEVDIVQTLTSDVLLARARGANVKIIGIRDHLCPIGTIALDSSEIRTPKDYSGKRWAHSAGNSPEQFLLDFLSRENGLASEAIERIHAEYPARLPLLIAGDVDFISAWWGSGYPEQKAVAAQQGVELSFLKWSDWGVNAYGECFAVRGEWLTEHRQCATNFLKMLQMSFERAVENPDLAVDAALEGHPQPRPSVGVLRESFVQSIELLHVSDGSVRFEIVPEKLKKTWDTARGNSKLDLETAFENLLEIPETQTEDKL